MTPAMTIVRGWDGAMPAASRLSLLLPMRIERWQAQLEGTLSQAGLTRKVQSLGYLTQSQIYPAGTAIAMPPDARACVQAVLSGVVKITIDGESAIVTAGDVVFVPARAVRRLEVIGDSAAHCLEGIAEQGSGD